MSLYQIVTKLVANTLLQQHFTSHCLESTSGFGK